MARPLRMESEAGLYHVLNRGNYRADIFRSDKAKAAFLKCLGEACAKTGWQVHAWCLIENRREELTHPLRCADRRSAPQIPVRAPPVIYPGGVEVSPPRMLGK